MTIHRSRFHALTLPLAMSLAAFPSCAADGDPTTAAYTITDSAGIRIVESLTPLWGDTPLQIAPEPLLRLGSEEEGPEQFGSVMWGILFQDGWIAVSEQTSSEVRLFDSTGQHQRTFGGAGDGPGEFRSLGGLFGFRGDSIAVYDQRLRRTTIFSLSSGAQRTVPNHMSWWSLGGLEPTASEVLSRKPVDLDENTIVWAHSIGIWVSPRSRRLGLRLTRSRL